MATLRAVQATDMRVEIARGLLTSFSLDRIEVSDGLTTETFRGLFSFSGQSLLGGFFPFPGDQFFPLPGDVPELLFIRTSGRLTGYDVELGSALRYTVGSFDVDARSAFQLLALRGTADFQRLVFAGNDSLLGSRFSDVLIGFDGGDAISGFDGSDRLLGGNGLDRLFGGSGNDVMTGGNDRDWLFGGDGNDLLAGNGGSDVLRGEDGNDVLIGGLGPDFLNGGPGADSFRFLSLRDSPPGSTGRDRIEDFSAADLIDLRTIDARAERQGNQPFVFIGDDPFTGQAGQLRFDPAARLLQGDATGDGRADFEVRFNAVLLAADDFLL